MYPVEPASREDRKVSAAECIAIPTRFIFASPSTCAAQRSVSLPSVEEDASRIRSLPAPVEAVKMPLSVESSFASSRRAQYAPRREAIQPIGSSPARSTARSVMPKACARRVMTATSCPAVILLTVMLPVSDSTCSSPVRSPQNGILTVLPPVPASLQRA